MDFNHPLAGKPLTLSVAIEPGPTNAWPDGRGRDLISALLDDGPGMQGRHGGLATDFFEADSFDRFDPSDDADCYHQPRQIDHLDCTAIREIAALYGSAHPATGSHPRPDEQLALAPADNAGRRVDLERPGLVLEYFHRSQCFQHGHTYSLRGRSRPANDPYAHRLPHADPVHAVWAFRSG